MKLIALIFMSLMLLLPLQACKWRDDFRERKQPYYLDYQAEPTFNTDSDQYVGDDVVREFQGEVVRPVEVIPEIDNRVEMPYIPDYPAGVVEYDYIEIDE